MNLNIEKPSLFGIKCENVQDRHLDDSGYSCENVLNRHSWQVEPMQSCNRGDCKAVKVSDSISHPIRPDPFDTFDPNNYDCKAKKVSSDVVDLLPPDPFEMGLNAPVTNFAGWIEDFSLKNPGFECIETGSENFDHQVVAELNIVLEGSPMVHYAKSSSGFEVGINENRYVNFDDFMSFHDKYCSPRDGHGKPNAWVEDNLEDFSLKNLGLECTEIGLEKVDHQVVAELNIVREGSPMVHCGMLKSKSSSGYDVGMHEIPYVNFEDFMRFHDRYWSPHDDGDGYVYGKPNACVQDSVEVELGPPPDALFFVLGYLGVRDLLSVEGVCKSLRDAVQTDPLVWRNIQIDYPLCDKITDDVLVRLAQRAQGILHSLSLIWCRKITDLGLNRVLETNTRLMKLNVTGCLSLSIQCIISNMKLLKSTGKPGIKCLRILGIFDVTSQNFEELKLLLSDENQKLPGALKPRFFQGGKLDLPFDDDHCIDVEPCPRCERVRQVFDCPADSCRGKWNTLQACRACIFCIPRCISCGRCLTNCDYEETFHMDLMCLDCWNDLVKCQEKYNPFCRSTLLVHRQVTTVTSVDSGLKYNLEQ